LLRLRIKIKLQGRTGLPSPDFFAPRRRRFLGCAVWPCSFSVIGLCGAFGAHPVSPKLACLPSPASAVIPDDTQRRHSTGWPKLGTTTAKCDMSDVENRSGSTRSNSGLLPCAFGQPLKVRYELLPFTLESQMTGCFSGQTSFISSRSPKVITLVGHYGIPSFCHGPTPQCESRAPQPTT